MGQSGETVKQRHYKTDTGGGKDPGLLLTILHGSKERRRTLAHISQSGPQ